jgi:hypothetical protein
MKAIELQGQVMLHFTRILDTEETEEEDETNLENPVTPADWQKKTSEAVMNVVRPLESRINNRSGKKYKLFPLPFSIGI